MSSRSILTLYFRCKSPPMENIWAAFHQMELYSSTMWRNFTKEMILNSTSQSSKIQSSFKERSKFYTVISVKSTSTWMNLPSWKMTHLNERKLYYKNSSTRQRTITIEKKNRNELSSFQMRSTSSIVKMRRIWTMKSKSWEIWKKISKFHRRSCWNDLSRSMSSTQKILKS